jgi:hypothetical protein
MTSALGRLRVSLLRLSGRLVICTPPRTPGRCEVSALLPQPGGFESLIPIQVHAVVHDFPLLSSYYCSALDQ